MRHRPDHLLRNLLIAALITLAAMHPTTIDHLTQLGAGLVLAVLNGIATAARQQPGPAILAAGLIWLAYQLRTRRPARPHT
ncbi:hypothetical protein [Streptomyces sp. NPDC002573]|uniref:hypothetical protein n=1 Tax=Streptomyces sp. NPDC002573 TaxID=3364651 RepID=UPI0036C2CA61